MPETARTSSLLPSDAPPVVHALIASSSSRAPSRRPGLSGSGFPALQAACCLLICLLLAVGCAKRQEDLSAKFRQDSEETMAGPYSPRDDGLPLTTAELRAFKTVSELDRNLSPEDANIVELHFKEFVHNRRGTFERFLARSARFLPYIKKIFRERGIPEDVAYLAMVESGGNPNAISPAGAVGLWQFMPFTGKKFGLDQNSWMDERRDPFKATYAASDYLLKLYGDFGNWHLAIAAYNAGEGKIGRAVEGTGAKDFFELCRLDCQLEESRRLKPETRNYVPMLIAMAKIMRNLDRLGFSRPPADAAWNLATLNVPGGTNLSAMAQKLGLTWEEFAAMNPAYRRTASPPARETTAYLPSDKVQPAVIWLASNEARTYANLKEYTIRKGDTLASIAKRHGTSVSAIRTTNNIAALPKRGSSIMIPAGAGEAAPVYAALPESRTVSPSGRQSASSTYVVRKGDTIGGIAARHGVSVTALCAANGLDARKPVAALGRKLSIPGSGGSAGRETLQASAAPSSPAASAATTAAARGKGRAEQRNARSAPAADALDSASLSNARVLGGKPIPASRAGALAGRSSAGGKDKPILTAQANTGKKGKTVTVKAGDTLYSIARASGSSVSDMQKANRMGSSVSVRPGQKLVVP